MHRAERVHRCRGPRRRLRTALPASLRDDLRRELERRPVAVADHPQCGRRYLGSIPGRREYLGAAANAQPGVAERSLLPEGHDCVAVGSEAPLQWDGTTWNSQNIAVRIAPTTRAFRVCHVRTGRKSWRSATTTRLELPAGPREELGSEPAPRAALLGDRSVADAIAPRLGECDRRRDARTAGSTGSSRDQSKCVSDDVGLDRIRTSPASRLASCKPCT